MIQENQVFKQLRTIYVVAKSLYLRFKVHRRVKFVRQRAEQGVAEAQAILGVMYSKGIGVVKDERKALMWFYEAAEQGDSSAQFIIGVKYSTGNRKNYMEAFRWFGKAADQNNTKAQIALKLMYESGIRVLQSKKRPYMD